MKTRKVEEAVVGKHAHQSRKSFAWLAVQWRTACLYAALTHRTPPAEQPSDGLLLMRSARQRKPTPASPLAHLHALHTSHSPDLAHLHALHTSHSPDLAHLHALYTSHSPDLAHLHALHTSHSPDLAHPRHFNHALPPSTHPLPPRPFLRALATPHRLYNRLPDHPLPSRPLAVPCSLACPPLRPVPPS